MSASLGNAGGIFLRFARDRRGVSAVEFAMIAPVMIVFYFGLAEFCQGFMAQKRMGHSASMVADLVAQTQAPVTVSQLDDVIRIGDHIMRPFSAAPLQLRLTSLTQGADGVVRVDWSHASEGMTALADNAVVEIPDDLIENGESLVMSEATYDYDSPVKKFLPEITQFSQTHYLRPRSVNMVECSDCPENVPAD
jgi:Flp pilus assembly protein TadG